MLKNLYKPWAYIRDFTVFAYSYKRNVKLLLASSVRIAPLEIGPGIEDGLQHDELPHI